MKHKKLQNELKECVPITARTKKFPLKKGEITVIAERKQFLLILGHAITVHKSQGSTPNYMKGDLSRSTGKKTGTGKTYQQPISRVQFYTLLSCAKNPDKVLLLNFDPGQINVNESALEEIIRMRQESVFFTATSLERFQWHQHVSSKHKVMECSFRTFSQGQHLPKLFQLILFH